MPYEFVDEVTTADIAFRAWGETLEETFVAAATAVVQVMVENLDAIRPCQEQRIMVDHEALDLLLFNFLQEFVYYKDAEQLLLMVAQVEIATHAGHYRLTTTARGERLDPTHHDLRVDVKAVTLHRFCLQQRARGWEALVILDI
jgi:SHS2 domain-containing protein